MTDFERGINDWYAGVGKERTLLSGTWRSFMQQVIEIESIYDGYTCIASWQEDDMIHFVTRYPDNSEAMALMPASKVSLLQAVRVFASLKWQYENPPEFLLPQHADFPPPDVVQLELWLECWQACNRDVDYTERMYRDLGGEFKEAS